MKRLKLDPEDEYLRGQCRIMLSYRGVPYAYLIEGAVPVHRFITNAPKGIEVDHKNGDTMDNRKENLRLVTRATNSRNVKLYTSNKSGYKGVAWCKRSKKWYAYIEHQGKMFNLGLYKCKEEANVARLRREIDLWGVQPQRLVAFQAAGLA